jgi:hypothetical protein
MGSATKHAKKNLQAATKEHSHCLAMLAGQASKSSQMAAPVTLFLVKQNKCKQQKITMLVEIPK